MKAVTTLVAMLIAVQSFAFITTTNTATLKELPNLEMIGELPEDATQVNVQDFLDMTPKKYKEMTGKKLGIKNTLVLKAAQKAVKKQFKSADDNDMDIPKGLYIVGVILGWGWLLMGLMDGFSGNNWWVNLILTALCWLPGVIHGLVKMKDYY